jgi:hypothetical protein
MKLNSLWILLVFVPVMSADVITCNSGADSVPIFNTSSTSAAVGDYTLSCTGGVPVIPPDAIPVIDFTASLNVPILNTGGWILTDGVNNTAGVLESSEVIEFFGVPLNPPGAGSVVFTVENIFVNPSAQPPGFQFTENSGIFGNQAVEIMFPQQVVAQNAVPEPFSLVFVGLGLGAMCLGRKRVS